LIWGVNFSVIKVALEELAPLAFNALRFPLASLVLLVLLRARGPLVLPSPGDRLRLLGLGLLGNTLYQLFFILGIDRTTAGDASLLLATTPVWTLLLSFRVGHERPSGVVWVGVAGTAGGMGLVVVGGGGVHFGPQSLGGDLLMVGASVVWALYTVGARNLVLRYGPLQVTAWTLWTGTAGILLLGAPALARTALTEVSPQAWGALTYAGTLAISLAYTIWYRGVQRLGNARTAVYSNLVPVVALAVAWLWLGERPGPLQLAGAGVILLGLSLARLGGLPPRRLPPVSAA
jgi:drug/metabolite transporter (DMT)-like permease